MSAQEAYLLSRVEYWQRKLSVLGIGHFRVASVDIVEELDIPDAVAGVSVSEHYDTVLFEFRVEEAAGDNQTLDESIIHEWLHVAMRDLDFAIESLFTWVPDGGLTYVDGNMVHEREKFIERLARMLYAAFHDKSC